MSNKTMKDQLSNCFFNMRGEFSTNLHKSRSKVAQSILAARVEREAAKAETVRKEAAAEARRQQMIVCALAKAEVVIGLNKKIIATEEKLVALSREREICIKKAIELGGPNGHWEWAAVHFAEMKVLREELKKLRQEKKSL